MDVTQTLHELDLNMNFATTDQPLVGQIKNTKKNVIAWNTLLLRRYSVIKMKLLLNDNVDFEFLKSSFYCLLFKIFI